LKNIVLIPVSGKATSFHAFSKICLISHINKPTNAWQMHTLLSAIHYLFTCYTSFAPNINIGLCAMNRIEIKSDFFKEMSINSFEMHYCNVWKSIFQSCLKICINVLDYICWRAGEKPKIYLEHIALWISLSCLTPYLTEFCDREVSY
jgi:hypothetical protein